QNGRELCEGQFLVVDRARFAVLEIKSSSEAASLARGETTFAAQLRARRIRDPDPRIEILCGEFEFGERLRFVRRHGKRRGGDRIARLRAGQDFSVQQAPAERRGRNVWMRIRRGELDTSVEGKGAFSADPELAGEGAVLRRQRLHLGLELLA